MGAPAPEMNVDHSADESAAQSFLSSLRTISAPERRKHASVYNYWLSIRRDRDFPPIRDLDPLELSDAAPYSVLLEMVGGGEDAGIRHLGVAIKDGVTAQKLSEAASPSLLSCIASRLPVVAACRDAFAFEDEFETAEGKTRCWITLLPFSATGTWIDYVYGFVSVEAPAAANAEVEEDALDAPEAAEELAAVIESEQPVEELGEDLVDIEPAEVASEELVEEAAAELEPESAQLDPEADLDPIPEFLRSPAAGSTEASAEGLKPSFSEKFFEKLSNIGGFYGRPVEIELDPDTVSLETWEAEEAPAAQESEQADEPAPAEEIAQADEQAPEEQPILSEEIVAEEEAPEELVLSDAPASEDETPADELVVAEETAESEEPVAAEEPPPTKQPNVTAEGSLESKLTEVRAKADEARQAKLRANAALYEGLSAAYDFALDAEDSPDEYLKLVQAEGLKIQLRSPMKPVAKLAFDGMCDEITIKQLEAILAWAFEEELPRGKLAERIEEEGGIAPILNRQAKAA